MSNYTEQTRRIVRLFEKLPKENYSENFSEYDWDVYYCFFLNAFHLKDWIVNDSGNNVTNKDVNKFIEKSSPLKVLQSVVNGIKHCKIKGEHNKYNKIDFVFDELPKVQYKRNDYICSEDGERLLLESGDPILSESSEEGEIHPKGLAVNVLIEWNKFFKENDLKGYFKIMP